MKAGNVFGPPGQEKLWGVTKFMAHNYLTA